MPRDGFKDRIYHAPQETDEERREREAEEAEQERIERLRSSYGEHGRWYPGMEQAIARREEKREEAIRTTRPKVKGVIS